MRRFWAVFGAWLSAGVLASAGAAAPLERDAVPEPLRPWIGWVLEGHEDLACPFLHAEGSRACLWPGRLALDLGAAGGRFRLDVFAASESDVALPGGGGPVWPVEVAVDGRRVPVVEVEGGPQIRVGAGAHAVTGRFAWSQLPPGLRVPGAIGLVDVVLEGRPIAWPRRDAEGTLWLRDASADPTAGPVENRVEVEVVRRFEDAVPPRLLSFVRLRVSGETREERLGVALPEGWLATAIASPLPAQLDPEGRLRVQLRPGDWAIRLDARQGKPSLRLAQPQQPEAARWDESEIWSVALDPALRLVELTGAPAIDPTQAEIPPDWHALPTHRLDAKTALVLVEKRRGDEGSPGDQLTLDRTWYLDFDGGGATVLDRMQGTLRRSLRVEMGGESALGRAAIGGIDQPITRRAGSDRSGIETALGSFSLDADSRIDASPRRLAAVGWDHDVDQLSGALWLPPGYRLFHASGVDDATTTWLSRWNLLSVFFVLLMAVVSGRLFGARGAVLALATLVLVWNESGAPARIWLVLAVSEALRRAVGHGRFARVVRLGQGLVAVVFVVIALPFALAQLRGGLFPALAQPGAGATSMVDFVRVHHPPAAEPEAAMQAAVEEAAAPESPASSAAVGRAAKIARYADAYDSGSLGLSFAPGRRLEADPSSVVPTGPGRPEWTWERVALQWSGPVTRDHVMGLWLVPPWANGLLAGLRVVLVVALAALFVRGWRREALTGTGLGPLGTRFGGAVTLALAAVLGAASLVGVPGPARADMPTPELLGQLRDRLLENPRCLPECAVLSQLEVEVAPAQLRLRAIVEAREETGVPLPGGGLSESVWLPSSIVVDGAAATAIRRDASGVVWLRVTPGVHEVLLAGALPNRETVELPLPLAPRRAALAGAPRGWTVVGIGPDGAASGALQLVREAAAPLAAAAPSAPRGVEPKLESSAILPFVLLTRHFELGLRWQTQTRVHRIAPAEGPIVLEIPLVAGEAVTTPGIRVEAGRAKLTLAAGADVASYESTLEIAPALELRAAIEHPWSEVWQLSAAPVWHVDAEGIPPIDRLQEGARLREWRPWPGESLRLAIERPEGLDAATRTIDRAQLALAPGARATDATLRLALRSSQGGQHVVTLPEAAVLTSLTVQGEAQPLRQEGREVSLSLAPGQREVVLGWREPRGIRALFTSSEVGLGVGAVNAHVELTVPESRWLLYAGGPRLGPAVLFWPSLLVVAGLALLLARTGLSPLRTHQWLLLGLGMTQAPIAAGAAVIAWFVVLALRGRFADRLRRRKPPVFAGLQLALGLLTLAAGIALIDAIATGLLGTPEMRIAGNGSSGQWLRWFVDRTDANLPMPWLFSLSLWWYRAAMLAWSMWLALALVEWARWGFAQWSRGGMFRMEAADGPDMARPAEGA